MNIINIFKRSNSSFFNLVGLFLDNKLAKYKVYTSFIYSLVSILKNFKSIHAFEPLIQLPNNKVNTNKIIPLIYK